MKNRGSSIRSRGWTIAGKHVFLVFPVSRRNISIILIQPIKSNKDRILQFSSQEKSIPIPSPPEHNLREHSKLPLGTTFNFHRSKELTFRLTLFVPPRLIQVRNTRLSSPPFDLNLSTGKCVEPSSSRRAVRRLQFKHLPVSISAGDAVDKLA